MTYDSQHRLIAAEHDVCNGIASYCEAITYAPDNHAAGTGDSKCDGTVDDCFKLVAGTTGAVISGQTEVGCTGQPQTCVGFDYDDAGRSLKDQFDYGCDGTTDVCYDYTYEFDERNRATHKTQTTCDGTPVSCCTYSYD